MSQRPSCFAVLPTSHSR